MRRLIGIAVTATFFIMTLCSCGGASVSPAPTTVPTLEVVTPSASEPTPKPVPDAATDAGTIWAEAYLAFLADNSDILFALWPDGLSGVGFADLDLDDTPEMILFDMGASASLGAQLFDYVDGKVWCVSSVLDSAEGAFGEEHFSKVPICTSFFESFRLIRSDDGVAFWVESGNGMQESSWDELVRFACEDGFLTPVSVCSRYVEIDIETNATVAEEYTVDGEPSDSEGYELAHEAYADGEDMCYDAVGVFLWNDMERYDTTADGLLAMASDAAAEYVPLPNM